MMLQQLLVPTEDGEILKSFANLLSQVTFEISCQYVHIENFFFCTIIISQDTPDVSSCERFHYYSN